MSAFFHILVVIVFTAYHGLAVIIGTLLGRPRDVLSLHITYWARALIRYCGIRVRTIGLTPETFSKPVLIMLNHRSHFDTPCLATIIPRPPLFIAKIELRKVPVLGSAMAALGMLFLDRKHSAQARAMLDLAAQRIQAGDLFVMFPEGSRSKDGYALSPFKKGGFHLALDSRVDVLPIVITGTERILPKHSLRIRSGEATLRIGRLISVAEHPDVESLMRATREEMEALLAQTPAPR